MELDYGKILEFGLFGWMKQEGVWKYILGYFIYLTAVLVATSYVMYSVLKPFITFEATSNLAALNSIVYLAIFLLVLTIVSLIIQSAFSYLFIAKALNSRGRKFVEFDLLRWARFVVFEIATFFSVLFSIFNLKLLLVGIASIVCIGIGLLSIFLSSFGGNYSLGVIIFALFFILGLLLGLAYLAILIYNAIKLSMGAVSFVESEKNIMDALKDSWEMTAGSTLNIFIGLFLIGLIVGIIVGIGMIPSMAYNFAISFTNPGAAGAIGYMIDPIYLLLSIPYLVLQAVGSIMTYFGAIEIYSQLKGANKGASAVSLGSNASKTIVKRSFAGKKKLK